MNLADIYQRVGRILADQPDIAFAYLHGSVLDGQAPRDVDIAIYLHEEAFARLAGAGGVSMDFTIPLEMQLEDALGMAADVQVLNRAPLPFRARVISQGRTLVDHAPAARADFEYRSRYEYFDFRPKRLEYLADIIQ